MISDGSIDGASEIAESIDVADRIDQLWMHGGAGFPRNTELLSRATHREND